MDSLIKLLEKSPFSEQEILTLVDHKSNLVLYNDLANYSNIDQLLGKHGACIILYVTDIDGRHIMGHWVCIFKTSPTALEFFDSYGHYPDDELDYTLPTHSHLTDLLEHCNYNIVYNKTALQSSDNRNVSTCGRHVGMRLVFRKMPLKKYVALMQSGAYSPDGIVTLMTAFIK